MRFVAVAIVLTTVCSVSAEDMNWLRGEWISDADVTIGSNPRYASISEDETTMLHDLYGKMRWRLSDSELTVVHFGESEPVEYKLRKLGDGSYFLELEHGPPTTLLRTDTGFCMLFPTHEKAILDPNSLECFKPYEDV